MRSRLVLGALWIAVACSGGDAGPDTAAPDGGGDALGFDASDLRDGAADASDAIVDASPDAPLRPDDPGWVRLQGSPDECYTERAHQPEAVMALHWEPCSDGLPSCEMAVLDRSIAPLHSVAGVAAGSDGRGLLHWVLWDGAESFGIDVVTRFDAVVAAWRSGPGLDHTLCGVSLAADRVGMGAERWHARGSDVGAAMVGVASWNDLTSLDAPVWVPTTGFLAPGDFLQAASASATTFAAMTTTGHIVAVEPANGAVIGDGDRPVVVGRSVLWNWSDASGASGIHLGSLGSAELELYRAPPGTHAYGVRADGSWIVWRGGVDDSTGATFPLNELWAAPYSETPPLTARRVGSDLTGEGALGTIGDGMFAYQGADSTGTHQTIYAIDLDAATRRAFVMPTELGMIGWGIQGDPAWVTRTEVVVPAVGGSAGHRFDTAIRIDLTALTPTPLP